MVFLRPNLSLSTPPAGRATRFMNANPAAKNPANRESKPNVSMKKNGSIDTTANSEPNVTK